MIGSAALIVSRLDDLRSERRIESLASRESVFLINNLLLVGLAAVIFWGTFFPLISELFTGQRSSLRLAWFDRYTAPLAILLVLFTGIGPLFAWRRVSLGAARRLLLRPALVAAAAAPCWWRRSPMRGSRAAGAGPVHLRRLRPGRAGAGVRPRCRRLQVARRGFLR